jgi:hypothetical protein
MHHRPRDEAAASLTDDALTVELGLLAGREREATATFIVHLAEFDGRRLYEGAGYPSMFAYCRAVLRLSEDAAYNRIKAARAARDYPEIAGMLAEGSLSPTTVRLLAPHLTSSNNPALLRAAAGLGIEGVKELLARLFPQPDVAASVRKLPSRATPAAVEARRNVGAADTCAASVSAPQDFRRHYTTPSRGHFDGTVEAATRSPTRARALRGAFHRGWRDAPLLREAQDLLGHALPPVTSARFSIGP